jgi:hypothetical protein
VDEYDVFLKQTDGREWGFVVPFVIHGKRSTFRLARGRNILERLWIIYLQTAACSALVLAPILFNWRCRWLSEPKKIVVLHMQAQRRGRRSYGK